MTIRLQEVLGIEDPNLDQWLNLYEAAFPEDERMYCSFILRILLDNASKPSDIQFRLLSVVAVEPEGQEEFRGLVMYERLPESKSICLWYLAIDDAYQGTGLGSEAYRQMIKWASEEIPDLQAIVFEIERSDIATNEEKRREDLRRERFYQRLGAKIARNVIYYQSVERKNAQPKKMYLCIHLIQPLNQERTSSLFLDIFGNEIEKFDEPLILD